MYTFQPLYPVNSARPGFSYHAYVFLALLYQNACIRGKFIISPTHSISCLK